MSKTNSNGGYYLGRYEASQGSDGKADSQVNKNSGMNINQATAATKAREMYNSSYIESDLANSYTWDTAIVFIQKYSGNSNYSNKKSVNTSKANTGVNNDKVCNIHDMASNQLEWTTEHSTNNINAYCPLVIRGGHYNASNYNTSTRASTYEPTMRVSYSFRSILYLK